MKKVYSFSLLVALVLICAACSNVRQAPVEERQETDVAAQLPVDPDAQPPADAAAQPRPGTPVREQDDSQWEQLPGPEAPADTVAPAPGRAVSDNPAVLALLDDADLRLRRADPEAAASSLERALRLEPKNPWLWHQLALLKLEQGHSGLAVALAQKSNSLAASHPALRKANAGLIRRAQRESGN